MFCTGVGVLPRLDPSRHELTRGVLLELTRLTIVIQVGWCTCTWRYYVLDCWVCARWWHMGRKDDALHMGVDHVPQHPSLS